MPGIFTDYACCPHCDHEYDGGPPHEDPCPMRGCTAGQAVIGHSGPPATDDM